MSTKQWENYQTSIIRYGDDFSIDFSMMGAPADLESKHSKEIERAYQNLDDIESGKIANPDENRMVGHYWLRNTKKEGFPQAETAWIEEVNKKIKAFAKDIHDGAIKAPCGEKFSHVLLVGIGGSALGPQLVDKALADVHPPMTLHFLDNTDPGGIDDTLDRLGDKLAKTLVIVTSKSGGTAETRNGMLEVEKRIGADFSKQAVAVTGKGSKLDQLAEQNGWLTRFEMEDWVGGRTSVMSAVGLLPAALTGIEIDDFLKGAGDFDEHTRSKNTKENAALQLALMWHHAGGGKGKKDMVIIPYCDRLDLMSKYLQQLVMESLGKEKDLGGNVVHQGIAVYGNKGSTDQHAYVQQLRDGVDNFFVTFIEVQKTRSGGSMPVGDYDSTTGDYLQGFLRGTRKALHENGRQSITITIPELNAYQLGALIALFERAVSFYAALVNINAYHQPGVEAGKVAAQAFLRSLSVVKEQLPGFGEGGVTAAGMHAKAEPLIHQLEREEAKAQGKTLDEPTPVGIEDIYHCLNHLAGTGFCEVKKDGNPADDRFWV